MAKLMYIGPTVLPLGLQQSTMYSGTEKQIKNLIGKAAEIPLFSLLLAKPEEIHAKTIASKTKGTAESLAVSNIYKKLRGEI